MISPFLVNISVRANGESGSTNAQNLTKNPALFRAHTEQEREDSDLEDVFVEAGSVKDMEAALEKAKALKAMLASGLPSKVRPRTPATPATLVFLTRSVVSGHTAVEGELYAEPSLTCCGSFLVLGLLGKIETGTIVRSSR